MGLNLLGIFLGGCTVWVLITQQMWKALGPKKPIMCDFFASVFLGIGLRFWESRCFPEGIRFFSVENLCPMFHGRCLVIQTKETRQKHRHGRMSWSDGDFVGVDSWTPEVSWFHWQILERSCWNWPLKEAWTADKCQETWASVLNLGLETRILFYKKGKWYQLSWGYTPQFNRPLFFFPYVCLLFFCLSWDANPLPATVTTRMTLHIYTYNRRKMEGILSKTFTCYREMENPEVEVQ